MARPSAPRRRLLRLPALAVVAALSAAAALPASAAGHASFLEGTPGAGQRVEQSPARIALAFTEPINAPLTRVEIIDAGNGEEVATRRAGAAGRKLTLRPEGALEQGAYRVRWRTVSSVDGHVRQGYFSFGVGAAADAQEGLVAETPLARSGWVRVVARLGLYLALLVFAGALLLRALRGAWLALPPADAREAPHAQSGALRRERDVTAISGALAALLGFAVAGAEGADAVGSVSLAIVPDFLLANGAGLARLAVPLLVMAALALALARRYRPAALVATAALGAIAASGHAAAASPPQLAVLSAWVHLVAAAVWLGGIVLLAAVWGPQLRALGSGGRRALLGSVLPRFGRLALPAFLLVVATGTINSIVELGELDALWATAYGRVLLVKIALVLAMAAVGFLHVRGLRPRLVRLGQRADERTERRHWRLLRTEPLLGAGAIAAVAFLVGFPTPPRELAEAEASGDEVRRCDPCPVPVPRPGELSVAAWTGREIVAGWIRREGPGLAGTVRIYKTSKGKDGAAPADLALRVLRARHESCGRGCVRFSMDDHPSALRVDVAGRTAVALPARWERAADQRARRIVAGAFERLRRVRTLRLYERATSDAEGEPGVTYRLRAPDLMAYRTSAGTEAIRADRRSWIRPSRSSEWQRLPPTEIPYRTSNWLRSQIFVQGERLLRIERERGRPIAVVAYMDSGTPGWATTWIDIGSQRVRRVRTIVENNVIEHRYRAYNAPVRIELPGGPRDAR